LLTSCVFIVKNVFGFKVINEFDYNQYKIFLEDIKRPDIKSHYSICDSTFFDNISNYALSNNYKSLLIQPMKAYLFENNELIFFVANCLVPPKYPNLNWNFEGKFEKFPPKNTVGIDSFNLNLNQFIEILPSEVAYYKYIYIIDWSLMTERQSKALINQVYYNIDKFQKNDSIMIVFNNTDDFYIKCGVEF
jgi:hypothetical protein